MRRVILLFVALLGALASFGQSGGEVLKSLAERMAALGAWRMEFALEMAGAETPSEGFCVVANERYIVGLEDMMQGYDGEVVWMVNGAAREITLDTPPKTDSRSLFDNPTRAFDFADELFDVEDVDDSAGGEGWHLVLRPKEGALDGVERVVLEVNKTTSMPTLLGYDMAGAGLYFRIKSITPTNPSADAFGVPEREGFEVIDFR